MYSDASRENFTIVHSSILYILVTDILLLYFYDQTMSYYYFFPKRT